MRFLILFVFLLYNSNAISQEWEIPITVTDGNTVFELRLGIHPDATEAYDADFDTKAPPPPPSGNFDTRWKPVGLGTDDLFVDIRNNSVDEKTFIMTFQAASGFGPIVIKWDTTGLGQLGTFNLIDNINGVLYGPLDMTTVDSLDISSAGGLLDLGVKILVTPKDEQLISPVATFDFDTDIGRSPLSVNFYDQSSDSDGELSQWLWDFGDGNSSDEQNPTYTYQETGTYFVELLVTDNDQLSDTAASAIPIVVVPQNAELISDLALSNRAPENGADVSASVIIDMTSFGEEFELGSFSGSIEWDSEVLKYAGNSGLQNNFTGVVNEQDSLQGNILFNGANPSGVNGTFTIIDFDFMVVGQAGAATVLDLDFSSMALAFNFKEINEFITVNDDSLEILTSIGLESEVINEFSLHQNYPNPFNPKTIIQYNLPYNDRVEFQIFNSAGQLLDTLKDEIQPAGVHSIVFDGQHLPSGVYFYKISTTAYKEVKKMYLIK